MRCTCTVRVQAGSTPALLDLGRRGHPILQLKDRVLLCSLCARTPCQPGSPAGEKCLHWPVPAHSFLWFALSTAHMVLELQVSHCLEWHHLMPQRQRTAVSPHQVLLEQPDKAHEAQDPHDARELLQDHHRAVDGAAFQHARPRRLRSITRSLPTSPCSKGKRTQLEHSSASQWQNLRSGLCRAAVCQ